MKIWFFPGVGADESLAPFHVLPGFDTAWVHWPDRAPRDWPDFIAGLSDANPIKAGDVFIGLSFGGMAAQMLADRVRPAGIILISSCRSSRAIVPHFKALRFILPWMPQVLFDMRWIPRWAASLNFGIRDRAQVDLLFAMGRRLRPARFKAINRLALSFPGQALSGIPVFSIHGGKDRLIAAHREPRDAIIPDGGHLISMTHSSLVNGKLIGWLEAIRKAAAPHRRS